jgi:hypothetical protein
VAAWVLAKKAKTAATSFGAFLCEDGCYGKSDAGGRASDDVCFSLESYIHFVPPDV